VTAWTYLKLQLDWLPISVHCIDIQHRANTGFFAMGLLLEGGRLVLALALDLQQVSRCLDVTWQRDKPAQRMIGPNSSYEVLVLQKHVFAGMLLEVRGLGNANKHISVRFPCHSRHSSTACGRPGQVMCRFSAWV